MGEASRRGTFTERKIKAVEKNEKKLRTFSGDLEKRNTVTTLEEKTKRYNQRTAIMLWINLAKKSGLTLKEFKRRLKRDNKKG